MAEAPRFFDEMRDPAGRIRPGYEAVERWVANAPPGQLEARKIEAEHFFRRIGITFNVYGDAAGAERLIPFDIIPRVLTSTEWTRLTAGLEQRVKALNAFIADAYGEREIVMRAQDRVAVRLHPLGPRVINPQQALARAARQGFFLRDGKALWPRMA